MDIFKPVQLKKVYLEIAEQITDTIACGVYKPNDKLPSGRRVSELTSSSRTLVRDALSVLDAVGILNIKIGQGTFVSESLENQSFYFKQDESPYDLLEARRLFEESIVDLIIDRTTFEHLEKLEENIIKMEAIPMSGQESLSKCYEYSIEFHRIFASLAGNSVLEKIGLELVDSSSHPMAQLLNR